MTKRTNLSDIAQALNISKNTVSLALRGMHGVKDSTRELILKKASELGYMRSNNLETSSILLITTVDSSNDTYFLSYMLHAIEDELNTYGYKLVVINHINDKSASDHITGLLNQINPKGIIILEKVDERTCNNLIKSDLPIICVAFYYPDIFLDSVIEDNISGMRAILKYLIEKDYKSFGFIGNINGYISFWERWISFLGYLTAQKVQLNPEHCLTDEPLEKITDSDWLAAKFRSMNGLPEVFVCANDKIAANTLKALHTIGLSIPNDIGVVGFDNSQLAKMTIPTLTTVDSFMTVQCQTTVNILLNKINNQNQIAQRVVLPVKFIEGLSTR